MAKTKNQIVEYFGGEPRLIDSRTSNNRTIEMPKKSFMKLLSLVNQTTVTLNDGFTPIYGIDEKGVYLNQMISDYPVTFRPTK